jgi:hypothetical protein
MVEKVCTKAPVHVICFAALLVAGCNDSATQWRWFGTPDQGHVINRKTLTKAEAEVLFDSGKYYQFDSLEAIDEATAEVLAKRTGPLGLSLCGVKWLNPATAKALASYRGTSLWLPSLERLDSETAAELALFQGSIQLDSLKIISADAAKALATGRVSSVALDGLTELKDDALQEVINSGKFRIPPNFRDPAGLLQRGKWYQQARSYQNQGGKRVPADGGKGLGWQFLDSGRVHIFDGEDVDQSFRWEVLSKNDRNKVRIKYSSVTNLPDEFAIWEFVISRDFTSAEVTRVKYKGGQIVDSSEGTMYRFP